VGPWRNGMIPPVMPNGLSLRPATFTVPPLGPPPGPTSRPRCFPSLPAPSVPPGRDSLQPRPLDGCARSWQCRLAGALGAAAPHRSSRFPWLGEQNWLERCWSYGFAPCRPGGPRNSHARGAATAMQAGSPPPPARRSEPLWGDPLQRSMKTGPLASVRGPPGGPGGTTPGVRAGPAPWAPNASHPFAGAGRAARV